MIRRHVTLAVFPVQAPVTSKDIFEVPPNAKESRESHSMFCFILEQSSSVLWSFGNVVSTKFEVQQIHGPRWSSEGTSCLKLVCDAQQLDLLCPSEDSRFYARCAQQRWLVLPDWLRRLTSLRSG